MQKQIITSILAILLSVVTSFASTTEPSIISKGKTFVIDTKTWKTETVDISISDIYGYIIFSDVQIMANSKSYNLENLPSGNYQVTISNDYKSIMKNIEVKKDMIIVDSAAETSFKPMINITDNQIDINYLTGGNGNTYIKIYKDAQTVFNAKISKKNSVNKRFDISNLNTGSYTIVISNNGSAYSRTFNK